MTDDQPTRENFEAIIGQCLTVSYNVSHGCDPARAVAELSDAVIELAKITTKLIPEHSSQAQISQPYYIKLLDALKQAMGALNAARFLILRDYEAIPTSGALITKDAEKEWDLICDALATCEVVTGVELTADEVTP